MLLLSSPVIDATLGPLLPARAADLATVNLTFTSSKTTFSGWRGNKKTLQSVFRPGTEGDNAAAKELDDALYHARDITDHTSY